MPSIAVPLPAYAPPGTWRRGNGATLLVVGLLHLAFVATFYAAARPDTRGLPAPVDESEPLIVLLLPEGRGEPEPARLRAQPAGGAAVAVARAPSRVALATAMAADADRRYVSADKLDIGPMPAGAPDLAAVMRRPVSAGKVVLRVYVSMFGLPDRVEVLGTPEDEDFARALRRAFEQTSFLPGKRAGRDVAAYVDYEFRTDLVVLPSRINSSSS